MEVRVVLAADKDPEGATSDKKSQIIYPIAMGGMVFSIKKELNKLPISLRP